MPSFSFSDYTPASAGSASQTAGDTTKDKEDYWSLSKVKKCYTDYLFSKRQELDEQIDARRYYHGSQYTSDQIKALQKRKQPIMTFNRVARKIDGVVGQVEQLRQDPKAFPRTPKHEDGAELATAAIRYVLDQQEFDAKTPLVARDGAVDGIGGVELNLVQGDKGDPEIELEIVDAQSFFYDPRSYKHDFSDARYKGCGKWFDRDVAEAMFPDADAEAFSSDDELVHNTDREMRWFASDGINKRCRIVDIWYQHNGGWCYSIFTGNAILMEGKSYLKDEKKKDIDKYLMWSGNVDQDGDRYGFVRNMKSPQDGINAKQSKMQHILASKRLFISQGAVDDVEKTRQEMARPDGVIITNRPVNEGIKADDQTFDFTGLSKMLELNLAEIENFGPTVSRMGQEVDTRSGRAIALLQQAGMAELGLYILAYRGWKIRVYRAVWNAAQQHWKAERWIRVTDDEGMAQFIQINGMSQEGLVNAIGSLDVDIILDEAPDAVTIQAQSFEVLQSLGPQFIAQFPDIALELSPLDSATKKKIKEKQEQGAQKQEPMQQLAMAEQEAKVQQTQADAGLKQAQTQKTLVEAQIAPMQAMMDGQGQPMQQEYELPPELQEAQAMTEIEERQASAEHKRAQALKVQTEAALAPQQMQMEFANAQADRQLQAQTSAADREFQARDSQADRQVQVQTAQADRQEQRRSGDADRKVAMKKATQKPNTPARR